jgi:hypothetical protein
MSLPRAPSPWSTSRVNSREDGSFPCEILGFVSPNCWDGEDDLRCNICKKALAKVVWKDCLEEIVADLFQVICNEMVWFLLGVRMCPSLIGKELFDNARVGRHAPGIEYPISRGFVVASSIMLETEFELRDDDRMRFLDFSSPGNEVSMHVVCKGCWGLFRVQSAHSRPRLDHGDFIPNLVGTEVCSEFGFRGSICISNASERGAKIDGNDKVGFGGGLRGRMLAFKCTHDCEMGGELNEMNSGWYAFR